jgi:peroxiredoxin
MRLFLMVLMMLLPLAGGNLTGKRGPSFSLPDSRMFYHDILDYRGKVLVIEFMQTTCPHCLTTSQTLEKVKAKFGDKITLLHVVNPPDTTNSVSSFVAKTKVTSPFLFDSGQVTASYLMLKPAAGAMAVDVPILVVLDAQGIVRDDYQGEAAANLTVDQLTAIIQKAMAPAPAKK